MPGVAFRDMLAAVKRSISKEETRYYLNGVYLHSLPRELVWNEASQEFDGAPGSSCKLRMVSTDGHRLYRADIPAPESMHGMPGVIVPRKTVDLVLGLTKGKACPETVGIEVSDTKIRFTIGDIEVLSKLVDGTFPDYQRVTPQGNDKIVRFDAADFAEALASVSLISSERGRAFKLTTTGDTATLSVSNPDSGTASMEFSVSGDAGAPAAEIEIGFNASYMEGLLADLSDDGGKVRALFSDPGSPTLFKVEGQDDFLAVLMPTRV